MTFPATLILSASDVTLLADAHELMAAVADSFREASGGEAQVPQRIKLSLAGTADRLIVMPANLPRSRALATKIITVFPQNGERSLPLITGVVILNDPETGVPLAIIDGGSITGLRTAAASAVAARALARPEAETLAIIGAGTQGRAHLWALAQLYRLKEVRVCALRSESAQRLASEAAPWVGGPVRAVATPEEAARGADLVVTATTAVRPVLKGDWLDEGAHVCAVGAATLSHRELDTDVLSRAAVIAVDTRDGALEEAGDLVIPINEGRLSRGSIAEVGEILSGLRDGRRSAAEITVYKGVGMAAADASVAALIYRRARERGLGVDVHFQ